MSRTATGHREGAGGSGGLEETVQWLHCTLYTLSQDNMSDCHLETHQYLISHTGPGNTLTDRRLLALQESVDVSQCNS